MNKFSVIYYNDTFDVGDLPDHLLIFIEFMELNCPNINCGFTITTRDELIMRVGTLWFNIGMSSRHSEFESFYANYNLQHDYFYIHRKSIIFCNPIIFGHYVLKQFGQRK